MKRKLLLAAIAVASVCGGGSSAFAQENSQKIWQDVTDYIQNADFEDEQYEIKDASVTNKDRHIYEPNQWNLQYDNPRQYDMTILTLAHDLSDGTMAKKIQIPTEDRGNQTYAVRFHNAGDNQRITLSQTIKDLPEGIYRLSGDFFTENRDYMAVGFFFGEYSSTNRIKYEKNNDKWESLSTIFYHDGSNEKTFGIFFQHGDKTHRIAGVDNIKLEKLLPFTEDQKDIDVTELIKNAAVANASGWENGKTDTKPLEKHKDAPDDTFLTIWHERTDIKQSITLPQGVYKLTAATRATTDTYVGSLYVLVKDNEGYSRQYSTDIHHVGSTGNTLDNGWGETEIDNIVVDETYADVTIGFSAECDNSWANADDFRLTYLRKYDEDTELATAKANARDLAAAYAAKVTQWVGTDAFYVPEDNAYVSAVNESVTAVQTAVDEDAATFNSIQEALNGVKDAKDKFYQNFNSLELVEPDYDAQYNILNSSFEGKALTFKSAIGADLKGNTTTMGWDEDCGSIYPQAVKFVKVEGAKNQYKIGYTRADGETVYIGTGNKTGLASGRTDLIRPTTDETKALAVEIQYIDGVWALYNTENNNRMGTSNGATGLYTSGSNYSVKFQKAVEVTIPVKVNISEKKYGTLIVPFDAEVPENATAYIASRAEGTVLILDEVKDGIIKANVPYLLYAEEKVSNVTLSGIGAAYTDETLTKGLLTGVYNEKTITADAEEGCYNYVLQTQPETGQAFYKVGEGKSINIPKNRCYLTAPIPVDPETGEIKAYYFGFGDDDATAIEAVPEVAEGAEKVFYNLAGQRVANPTKGIYIVNGKKVLVK